MRYDRTVIAYHGCDAAVADRLLRGEPFRKSENDYDWLGTGIYFWEYGADRALRFAREQQRRGRITEAAVVGALIQLGRCFDLMDTKFTMELGRAYEWLHAFRASAGHSLPVNAGTTPDQKLRRLDCSILNAYFDSLEGTDEDFDTVRCCFTEGSEHFPTAGSSRKAISRSRCETGLASWVVFRPTVPS